MAADPRFFPYDPRALRYGLVACALASAALAAFALSSARATGDGLAYARAALLALLLGAFVWLALRARPRAGWGVTVDRLGLIVARPLGGEDVRVVWAQLSAVKREGRRRDRLALLGGGGPEERLVLPRRLFGSREDFEALAQALEARFPAPRLDA